MIVYDKLWTTLKEKNISQYTLINKYHVRLNIIKIIIKNFINYLFPYVSP